MSLYVDRVRVDDHDLRNRVVLEKVLQWSKSEGLVCHLCDEARSIGRGVKLWCKLRNDLREGLCDSWPKNRGVHISTVERREVEVVQKGTVNSPPNLGGRAADNRLRCERGDPENIRTHAQLSVGKQRRSRSAHRLVSQDRPVGRLVHDSNATKGTLDAEVNPADRRRWENDVTAGVTTYGQRDDLLNVDLLLGAVWRHDQHREAGGH
jgi:hypothetical protein